MNGAIPVDVARRRQAIVVGAGPTGLALAIELGTRGIDCLVVERNARAGHSPRAKTTNVRTRTHLRRWGIAGKLADASPFGVDYPSDVHFVTRLAGPLLATIGNASNCAPARHPAYPEHGQWVPQYKLENVLREHAASLPSVDILFGSEVVTATQDEAGVTATILHGETRARHRIDADFLIGADGARSGLRELIGAAMSGTYGLSRNYNIVFRAPGLAERHRHGPGTMYWQVHPTLPSLIGPMDVDDVWFFMPTRLPDGVEITPDAAADLIRDATGIDLPYEILSSEAWTASSLIADRYRDRRVFLAGDACHLHPPFGGFGMNMGVADGVDLGWKLAAVLQGWGGPTLLDSYEEERRGIHEQVIEEAAANHAVLSNDLWHDDLEVDGPMGDAARHAVGARIAALKTREFHTLGTVLGGCYARSPVILFDDAPASAPDGMRYAPSSRPGCLAPHLWLADGRSLYDAFGGGFTFVARLDARRAAIEAARREASEANIPLETVYLSTEDAGDLYAEPLTLVRPDQFVAWRGERPPVDLLRSAAGLTTGDADARPGSLAAMQLATPR